MRDYFELGCTPAEEDCVQVERTGTYMPAMKAELARYRELLRVLFPIPDDLDVYFAIKWEDHDFGRYGEVAIFFNDNDPRTIEFACFVEEHTPATWDDTTPRVYTPELTDELLLQEA